MKESGDTNLLTDFRFPDFAIRLFCDACGRQEELDRANVPEDIAV